VGVVDKAGVEGGGGGGGWQRETVAVVRMGRGRWELIRLAGECGGGVEFEVGCVRGCYRWVAGRHGMGVSRGRVGECGARTGNRRGCGAGCVVVGGRRASWVAFARVSSNSRRGMVE